MTRQLELRPVKANQALYANTLTNSQEHEIPEGFSQSYSQQKPNYQEGNNTGLTTRPMDGGVV